MFAIFSKVADNNVNAYFLFQLKGRKIAQMFAVCYKYNCFYCIFCVIQGHSFRNLNIMRKNICVQNVQKKNRSFEVQ